MLASCKMLQKQSEAFHTFLWHFFFSSLKQNFIVYRSFKVSSCPDCIFEIHQLWQSGFSRVYSNCCCSCSFEPEIIKIGLSSHKMYNNNILNFHDNFKCQYKKVWNLIECITYIHKLCVFKYLSSIRTHSQTHTDTRGTLVHIHTRMHTHKDTHMDIYIYIYIYVYIYIKLYLKYCIIVMCIHAHIHTHIQPHIHTHIHTHTHTQPHTHTHIHTQPHTHTHTYIHSHTHMHTHIHTSTHIHTYTWDVWGVTVIVGGNGNGDQSSNPRRGCWRFSER